MGRSLKRVIAVTMVTCIVFLPEVFAQNVDQADNGTSLCSRPALFDCPGGARQTLRDRGVNIDARLTQFSQGVLDGDGSKSWQYGGKGDLIVNLDMSKLGLWRGFSVNVHQEWIYGEDANNPGNGELFPFNTALAYPRLGGSDSETALTLRQQFGDSTSLSFGKFNMLSFAAKKPLAGGGGLDTFMNIGLAAPISGVTPPYLFGFIGAHKTEHAAFTLMVYDPRNSQDQEVIKNPFSEGTTTSISATFPVKVADNKGFYSVRGVYSSKSGFDLNLIPALLDLPPESESLLAKKGYWYLSAAAQQYLYHTPGNPDAGWGLFLEAAASDGNPNPLKWHFLVGLGGQGLHPDRPQDRWGVGYFKYGLSKKLVDGLAIIGNTIPFDPTFFIRDEQGVEIFYNLHVTPWLRITADLQRVKPHEQGRPDVTVGAVRAQIRF
ncbi:carbohydrate porin [Microbulbifer sp. MCCC 1A16149]|uniref:carbohydrate porin n=1 Tax=Microbulbifer sp. MCCC 1A16149 TaxID=3411322 RepID=UPI003D0A6AA2